MTAFGCYFLTMTMSRPFSTKITHRAAVSHYSVVLHIKAVALSPREAMEVDCTMPEEQVRRKEVADVVL